MTGVDLRHLLTVAAVLIIVGPMTAAPAADDLPAAANQEVAMARAATAKYHDVEQAIADGYVNIGYVQGEGYEFVNFDLLFGDCTFDPETPEALHYIPTGDPSGDALRLVGAEYAILIDCTATEPEGFSGDADEWEFMAEGFPIWALNAWLWIGNPNGVFAEPPHPRIP